MVMAFLLLFYLDLPNVFETDNIKTFGSKVLLDAVYLLEPKTARTVDSEDNGPKELLSRPSGSVMPIINIKRKDIDNVKEHVKSVEYIAKSTDPPSIIKSAKRKLAFAITVTSDGSILDGACVLAYSIIKSHKKTSDLISLVAFVHPSVTVSREPLRRLGYL